MGTNRLGHIDLRVTDRLVARAFYSRLLPALGFAHESHGENFDTFSGDGERPGACFFGYTEQREHVPNECRIAFWVESSEEVDRFGALLGELGAKIESGPRACTDYSPSYYAVFFEDPCGNKLEVYYRSN